MSRDELADAKYATESMQNKSISISKCISQKKTRVFTLQNNLKDFGSSTTDNNRTHD